MRKLVVIPLVLLLVFMLLACGKKEQEPVDLTQMMSEIEAEITLPDSMENVTAGDLQRLYDIDSSLYIQFAGKITTVGIVGDEIVIVEAVDGDTATVVKEKMDQRYQSKLREMEDYLPEEYDKISNGSVVAYGNYVALLVSSDQEKLDDLCKGGFDG